MNKVDLESLKKLIKAQPPIDDVERGQCAQLLATSFPKTGVHQWLPKVAYFMQHYPMMMNPVDVYRFLRLATKNARKDRSAPSEVPDDEIVNAINLTRFIKVEPFSLGKSSPAHVSREREWTRSPTSRAKIIAESIYDLKRLTQQSPNLLKTREIAFAAMYPNEDIRLAWVYDPMKPGAMLGHWNSPRLHRRGYPQWYVPNPAIGRWAKTRSTGRLSERALDNIGPRIYLVIEFDEGSKDDFSKIIWHLRDEFWSYMANLVMVIDSGGKSLHSFWFVQKLSEDEVKQLCKRAYALGACNATLQNRAQLVRVPDAVNENGNLQQIYYLNTKAVNFEL